MLLCSYIFLISDDTDQDSLYSFYRDIYYRDPTLFLNQSVVDRHVDTLALTFGVGRASLNVVSLLVTSTSAIILNLYQVAGVKGLIAGCFKATRKDDTIIDGTSDPEVRHPIRLREKPAMN